MRPRNVVKPILGHIWSSRVPKKISVFMWRLMNSFLAFPEILQQWNFHLPSKCPHCPSLDSIQHAFCECFLARQVWDFFSNLFHLPLIMHSGLYALLQSCWHSDNAFLPKEVVELLPSFICWVIWRARNMVIYDGAVCGFPFVVRAVTQLFANISP